MPKRGELFVFEGPNGVGKTTLSAEFALRLKTYGLETELMSFPGREEGTLGRLIYDLHHAPVEFGVNQITPAGLQTLHVAAHVDAIERRILPTLLAGKSVVLDRFWWSTWVYGLVEGLEPMWLKSLIRIERKQWGKVVPAAVFLLTTKRSWREHEASYDWEGLASAYRDLSWQEKGHYPVEVIPNEDSIEDTLERIFALARSHSGSRRLRILAHVAKGQESKSRRALLPRPKLQPLKTTTVFNTYWKFAAERQAIFHKRLLGQEEPWTTDTILQKHKFTNAYRASDRVSQFLIRHVIYGHQQESGAERTGDPDEIFFRIFLFKIFNRISTWKSLEHELGEISFSEYNYEKYAVLLSKLRAQGERIFSSAYIMPSGTSSFGFAEKHRNYLKLLERMIEDGVPWSLSECKSMREAFDLLLSYPTMGNFLAYQFVTDLNYSNLTNFSEMEFVIPGPGARDGIAKCFVDVDGWDEADVIRWVTERQEEEFKQRNIHFQDLWGRPLQLIDCQNLFCEVDKYSRVAHPEIQGLSGRTRIKQIFQPTGSHPQYFYPPKWAINDKIPITANSTEQVGADLTLPFI